MSAQAVAVTIEVLGQRVVAGAVKSHRLWTIVAPRYPEVQMCDSDLARCKSRLVKRLEPLVERDTAFQKARSA